jgi:hypothetical protein
MQRPPLSRLRVVALGAFATASFVVACNSILDFDQFQVGATDGGPNTNPSDTGVTEASSGGPVNDGGADAEASACGSVGPSGNACYSCAPTTTDQYLNSCAGTCIPFDNATKIPAQYMVNGVFVPPTIPDGGIK